VDVKVDGNNSWSEDMEWRPEFGAYRLTLETRSARGKVLYREHRHFTYSPYIDPKELPDSWPIGFHRHSSSPEMIPPMGVKWVRLWGGWGNMEPEPGKYEWEMMDVNVRMAKKYGYSLLWVCHGVPTWALPEEVRDEHRASSHYAPEDMDRLRPFLREFWKRYGDSGVVKAVEVGNELNAKRGWTPEEYAQLARVIYEETHRATDGVRVVGISMSGGTHIDYMEKSMDAGGDKYMDIASVHLYEIGNPVGERSIERKTRLFKETLKKYGLGDMPVWNTESGSSTDIRQDGVMVSQEELNRQVIQHPDFDPEMPWRVGNDWRGAGELIGTARMIRASYQQFTLGVEKNFPFQWSATPHHHWVHDWEPGGNVMPKIKVVATGVMSSMLRGYGPEATSDQPEIESPKEDWHAFAHRYEGPKGRMTVVYVHPKTYTGSGDQVAALAAGDDIKTKAENTLSPWLRTSEPEPVELKIPVDSEQVVVMDMFGKKRKPVEVVNGFALIAATEVPQYLIEM
jgi:coenzyme F420-reducing hydrogenase delta subunit